MSKSRGRPGKYEAVVKPRLDDIKKWAISGCTNKEIAAALGIAVSTFCEYMNKFSELRDSVESQRIAGVPEVKLALYRKAIGFKYEETKKVKRKDENGDEVITIEITEKQSLPDSNAIAMYLRNYDKEWRDKDAITNEFKKMELELKKTAADDSW